MSSMGMSGSSDSSSSDLAASLRQSPFGALLDLPGVTPATIFGNINPADYASLNDSSGGNPFAGAAAGSNPFTNYPGQPGLFSAATNAGAASSDAGGSASSNPFAGGASGGSNPFAGGGAPAAASSMGSASADSMQSAAMTSNDPTGAAGGAVAGAGASSGGFDASSLTGGDAASFLAQSPFGPLITQAGVDPNVLLASLSGGNNFSALMGLGGANNPFGDTTSSTGGIPAGSSVSGGPSSSDITSGVYAQITADGGTAPQTIVPTT